MWQYLTHIQKMKKLLSKILYYVGDLVSRLLHFNCFSWLYPLYSKIMLLSLSLDKNGKVWMRSSIYPKLSDKQMDELMSEVKKRNFVKKRKLHDNE